MERTGQLDGDELRSTAGETFVVCSRDKLSRHSWSTRESPRYGSSMLDTISHVKWRFLLRVARGVKRVAGCGDATRERVHRASAF